jgi:hypothetical protein
MKMATAKFVQVLISGLTALSMTAAFATDKETQNAFAATRIEQPSNSELPSGWHFVRTRNPHGGADAISIMHTADTSKSDLDLAGLVIRCSDRSTEITIVVIRPFAEHARPLVTVGWKGAETKFDATIAPPGTAILLPVGATKLVTGAWQAIDELSIQIQDGQSTISGVVGIVGLQSAFNVLSTSCPTQ